MAPIVKVLVGFALFALTIGSPTPPTHVVHEKRHADPARWTKRDRVEPHKLLPMRVGLAQTNLDNAYEHLMSVYVRPSVV